MGWLCVYCFVQLDAPTATVDHIVPLSRGGTNDIGNLTVACRSCNSRKGTRSAESYRAKLAREMAHT